MTQFEREIREAINRNSKENQSDTPDYILARYLVSCLDSFSIAVHDRDVWYGFNAKKPAPIILQGPEEQPK